MDRRELSGGRGDDEHGGNARRPCRPGTAGCGFVPTLCQSRAGAGAKAGAAVFISDNLAAGRRECGTAAGPAADHDRHGNRSRRTIHATAPDPPARDRGRHARNGRRGRIRDPRRPHSDRRPDRSRPDHALCQGSGPASARDGGRLRTPRARAELGTRRPGAARSSRGGGRAGSDRSSRPGRASRRARCHRCGRPSRPRRASRTRRTAVGNRPARADGRARPGRAPRPDRHGRTGRSTGPCRRTGVTRVLSGPGGAARRDGQARRHRAGRCVTAER